VATWIVGLLRWLFGGLDAFWGGDTERNMLCDGISESPTDKYWLFRTHLQGAL